jgi:hypothetical protein
MKKETIKVLDKLTVWAFFCVCALCILCVIFYCLYLDKHDPWKIDVSLGLMWGMGALALITIVVKHFILFPYEIKSAIGKSF